MNQLYNYKATVTRVVDGDTVDALIDLGFGINYAQRVRLFGINAPETRTRDKTEKAAGLASKARLKGLLNENKNKCVIATTLDRKGKYGRVLGTLWAETTIVCHDAKDDELLNTSVNEIELSVRAANCLNNANITTLGQLAMKSESELLKYRNFGKETLAEITGKINELSLGHTTVETINLNELLVNEGHAVKY